MMRDPTLILPLSVVLITLICMALMIIAPDPYLFSSVGAMLLLSNLIASAYALIWGRKK